MKCDYVYVHLSVHMRGARYVLTWQVLRLYAWNGIAAERMEKLGGGVWNGWTLLSSRSLLTRLQRGTGETVRSGEQVCGFYVCMDDFSLMHKWWNRWFCWFRELSFSCKWKRWYSIIELWILDVEWELCFGLCMNVGLLLNTKIRGTRAHYASVL